MAPGRLWGSAVADDKRDTPRPFDVATIEHLLRLMSDHDLGEVDLTEGDRRIRLRKAVALVRYAPLPAAAAPGAHAPGSPAPSAAPAAPPPPPAAAPSRLVEIKSDVPGTFYTRPAPDKPEYVKVGSKVTPDTVVCMVMAMKVENPIKAGVAGTVAEVCAKNEDGVGYGTVLFRVDPG